MQQKFVLFLAQYLAEIQKASTARVASIEAGKAWGYIDCLQHCGQLSMSQVDRERSLLSRVLEQRFYELGKR